MKVLGILTFLAGFVFCSQGYALIEGQVLVGQRSASISSPGTSYDMTGMETKMSVYVDPIPLIPVGAGLSFSTIDLGKEDSQQISGFKGSEISLDLTAWLPLGIAGFKPYAKLGYVISGEYTATVNNVDTTFDSSGTKASAGVKYSPLPFISVMLEVEKSTITLKPENGSDSESDNLSVFLGVAAGI